MGEWHHPRHWPPITLCHHPKRKVVDFEPGHEGLLMARMACGHARPVPGAGRATHLHCPRCPAVVKRARLRGGPFDGRVILMPIEWTVVTEHHRKPGDERCWHKYAADGSVDAFGLPILTLRSSRTDEESIESSSESWRATHPEEPWNRIREPS